MSQFLEGVVFFKSLLPHSLSSGEKKEAWDLWLVLEFRVRCQIFPHNFHAYLCIHAYIFTFKNCMLHSPYASDKTYIVPWQ